MDSDKDVRRFEMALPTRLADELAQLSRTLHVTPGETVGRALQLLSKAVEADRVTLVKGEKTTNVLVK